MTNGLSFDDSAAYERFIGKWGRAAGAIFLQWLRPPQHAAWLDLGCGTGLFTELIAETCAPSCIIGIDPVATQIDHARRKPIAQRAEFRVGDGQSLPFASDSFDVVASALVINFIPDRLRALAEMRRVVRPDGLVAGYVWDFMPELSPSGPFRLGLRDVVGAVPALPGAQDSSLAALASLFERAGLSTVSTRAIDVTVTFSDFEAFWIAQTPSYAPTTRLIAAMSETDQARVREAVRARLPAATDATIRYPARANAVMGRASRMHAA